MAQQIINTGTGELAGDGESIRSAFQKINSNFLELYTTGGPSGPSGPSGAAGSTGTSVNLFVGTVSSTTGTASVSTTGTTSNIYLNFQLPVGPSGPGNLLQFSSITTTTSLLSNDNTSSITVPNVGKAYIIYNIYSNNPSWVRWYADSISRDSDFLRASSVDADSSISLIVETISTTTGTIILAPGVNGFNNQNGGLTSDAYFNITNRSGTSTSVTITATIITLVA